MAKKLKGQVVSNATDKTVTVLVGRYEKDPKYKKYARTHKKYKAHDERNECEKGDWVVIEECRPISKTKRFKVSEKIVK